MTHDELLAKIKSLDGTVIFSDGRPAWKNVGVGDKINLALRAVVELHKPDEEGYCSNFCGWQNERGDGSPWKYPCPTIQAIEKELG